MRSDLPPEAFSKEMLSEAFNWLQTQPDSIREIVQTPDHLVSLYRKHQRQDSENDAPVTAKQFTSELKNLAKGLEKFSDQSERSKMPPAHMKESVPPPRRQVEEARPEQQPPVAKAAPAAPRLSGEFELDEKTRRALTHTRERFNLSSDQEALRMLVSIGFEKISKI